MSRAHDLCVAAMCERDDYAAMLAAACLPQETVTPLQIVTLVFGHTIDAARLATFAEVLSHAQRHQVPVGGLPSFLQSYDGDLSAIAVAERAAA
ncbi:hypothetical protein QP162_19310 [Sphingomonas aurantiaca]|uniref:hypothetical protein n=1 Tax=Sphingomonas aurantiaca TaxID=185949 RepID=UPI002FDF8E88